MKALLLAGGSGMRLYPNTKVTNKHLLPVYDQPMIHYPLSTLIKAGVTDILIIASPDHAGDFLKLLGGGTKIGCKIRYEIQEKPLGIAHAVGLAEDFVDGEKFVVILGDNIFEDDIAQHIRDFEKSAHGAMLFLKEVEHPERFGVARIENGKIVEMIEKPKVPPSNLITTGLYLYDKSAFDVIKNSKPSGRGEYEIEDVNNWYIRNGKAAFVSLNGFWSDAGTKESLHAASVFVKAKRDANSDLGVIKELHHE